MTTARYYTPSGRLIEGKGITPDIVVMQDVPGELKGSIASQSSADPATHLKNAEDAKAALQSHVPPDVKNDRQLIIATQILHGLWPKGASAKLPTTGKLPN